jgi:glycosyltransferase involved in cell wall biosynthesis
MTRRWSINGRFLAQPVTGVQRYGHEVVRALDALLAGNHPLARDLDLELLMPDGCAVPDLEVIRPRRIAGKFGGQAWEQLLLPSRLEGRGLLSLCNSGPLSVRRQIVCIHDVNTRAFPASYSRAFRVLYRVLHPLLGRVARGIATVSHYSAGQLASYGIAHPSRITVAGNGHEHVLRWNAGCGSPLPPSLAQRTILVVGSPAPHKNIGLVLSLAPKLEAAGLHIAVAGMRDGRVFRTGAAAPAANNVHWLGRLDDDALAGLMRCSLCLAFPSLAEGFGLPALEAMALGCPVVSSNSASLPEVCGEAALYASPHEPDAWLRQFLRLRDDGKLRQDLVARGLVRARHYSWRRTAEVYLEAMARIDGEPGLPQATSR